jgi:RNA polymerase sigma-70 factor (ECF subfamily)
VIDRAGRGDYQWMGEIGLTLEGAEALAVDTERPGVRARELVAQHFNFVWRLLRRLGVPEAEVDDAAQQVFIVGAQRLSDIPIGSERTFLYGTVLRTAATFRRSLRRRERYIEQRSADAESSARTPDEELEHSQALAFLDTVLNALDDELRDVFVLSEIEELSAPQVAGFLGIPVGTVASRLRRARHAFSTQLARLKSQRTRDR